jgi:anaerobic magnesium-protoporphyrin IX monomethyl ester cyclase
MGNRAGLNTGLAYLAGSLKSAGHDVHVIDFNNCARDEDKRLQALEKADLIGISVKSFTAGSAAVLAEKARKINKRALIVCGGCHITIDGSEYLRRNQAFDVGVMGEGENAIVDLCKGVPLERIPGVLFREGDGFVTNEPETIRDLDSLPYPDYSCFDSIGIYNTGFPYNQYPVLTSRGCPSKCVYCAVPLLSRGRWHARSPESIIDELEKAKQQYRLKCFSIVDDNFTVNIKRAKEFCQRLKETNLGMEWHCSSGIKALGFNDEMAGLMKSAGAAQINFGVETCDPHLFKTIGKGGAFSDITNAISACRKNRIKVGGFFIIGLPQSSKELDLQTVKKARAMKLDIVFWSLLSPYPGTDLYTIITSDSRYRFVEDWRRAVHCNSEIVSIFESDDYTAGERIDMFYYANIMTGAYGNVVNSNNSNYEKFFTLMRLIFKYDCGRFYIHLFKILRGFIVGIKLKTVKIGK